MARGSGSMDRSGEENGWLPIYKDLFVPLISSPFHFQEEMQEFEIPDGWQLPIFTDYSMISLPCLLSRNWMR